MSKVPAARQVLDMLSFLARQPGPVRASVAARELALPRSTVYHLLRELQDTGFVVHLADDRQYALGVSAYELSSGYVRQEPLQRLARVPLARLTDRTGHSTHLAVLYGPEVIYVIEERAPGRASLVSDVGVRLPAHLTASGRAMLAALPAANVRALFPDQSAFVLRHDKGPRSLSALRGVLADVRTHGFSTESGEVTPSFSSVAAAVCDRTGHPVASVALTFPDATVSRAQQSTLATLVVRTASEVSRRLGR